MLDENLLSISYDKMIHLSSVVKANQNGFSLNTHCATSHVGYSMWATAKKGFCCFLIYLMIKMNYSRIAS